MTAEHQNKFERNDRLWMLTKKTALDDSLGIYVLTAEGKDGKVAASTKLGERRPLRRRSWSSV
jgi:hypothetical protein